MSAVNDSRILIVDDDREQADSLRRVLALEGFQAESVYTPEDAIREVRMRRPAALISDFRMGTMTGLQLYQEVKLVHPSLLFILVTGYGTVETAVDALREGRTVSPLISMCSGPSLCTYVPSFSPILRYPTHKGRRVISVKIVTLRRLPKLPE